MEIDCHADAATLMQKMLNNNEMIDAWKNYGGNRIEKAETLFAKALEKALSDDDAAEKIITVRENPRAGEGAFDLQVGVSSGNRDREPKYYHVVNGQTVPYYGEESEIGPQIQCKLFNMIDTLSKKEVGKELLAKRLSDLKAQYPEDKSIAIANTWFQFKHNPDDAASAVKSLLDLVEQQPLDQIKEGSRPNSRQRRQAMEHVALWPLSRKCLANEDANTSRTWQTAW